MRTYEDSVRVPGSILPVLSDLEFWAAYGKHPTVCFLVVLELYL